MKNPLWKIRALSTYTADMFHSSGILFIPLNYFSEILLIYQNDRKRVAIKSPHLNILLSTPRDSLCPDTLYGETKFTHLQCLWQTHISNLKFKVIFILYICSMRLVFSFSNCYRILHTKFLF